MVTSIFDHSSRVFFSNNNQGFSITNAMTQLGQSWLACPVISRDTFNSMIVASATAWRRR
jgi:hypothetical protein